MDNTRRSLVLAGCLLPAMPLLGWAKPAPTPPDLDLLWKRAHQIMDRYGHGVTAIRPPLPGGGHAAYIVINAPRGPGLGDDVYIVSAD